MSVPQVQSVPRASTSPRTRRVEPRQADDGAAMQLYVQPVNHSVQRLKALAHAQPCDSAGEYSATPDETFDLKMTIFKTLPNGYKTLFQRTKLDARLQWHDHAVAAIAKAYAAAGPAPSISDDAPLHKFMATECDFKTEHADGSFLDHLHFCREYSARHYAAVSPRILLLHSIMGVGTNCFPMGLEKLPTLRGLLRAEEFAQIEAFPSVLRLCVHGPLLAELCACEPERLRGALKGLRLHRLLDNAPLELSARQLWVQLNLQLIHAIDFLPPGCWQRTCGEYFFAIFVRLHSLLTSCGELQAKVGWDPAWMQPLAEGARPDTWCAAAPRRAPHAAAPADAASSSARVRARVCVCVCVCGRCCRACTGGTG